MAAIKEIGATISRIFHIAQTIASAVDEQTASTSAIVSNVENAIRDGSRRVAASEADHALY